MFWVLYYQRFTECVLLVWKEFEFWFKKRCKETFTKRKYLTSSAYFIVLGYAEMWRQILQMFLCDVESNGKLKNKSGKFKIIHKKNKKTTITLNWSWEYKFYFYFYFYFYLFSRICLIRKCSKEGKEAFSGLFDARGILCVQRTGFNQGKTSKTEQ